MASGSPPLDESPRGLLAYGRLLRLSLAPSALADVAAGVVLGAGGRWPAGAGPWLLMLSSACVYHGAMALNDWADREHDGRTRPDRPIPSGAVPAGAALALALALPLLGIGLAFLVDPRLAVGAVVLAVLASGYDLIGRGPWLGPLLLGGCRAGNLGQGLAMGWLVAGGASGLPPGWMLVPPLLYGLYVFVVSRLGRLEDGEEEGPLGDRPKRLLIGAAACLVALPLGALVATALGAAGAPAAYWGAALALVLVLLAARGLWSAAHEGGEWTPGRVGRSMGLALRRLLIVSSATSLIALAWPRPDALVAAAAILGGYPLALSLRRVFPPS